MADDCKGSTACAARALGSVLTLVEEFAQAVAITAEFGAKEHGCDCVWCAVATGADVMAETLEVGREQALRAEQARDRKAARRRKPSAPQTEIPPAFLADDKE
jgi:hypothetical protein